MSETSLSSQNLSARNINGSTTGSGAYCFRFDIGTGLDRITRATPICCSAA
nr:hypothetical protein [Escherichia coli]